MFLNNKAIATHYHTLSHIINNYFINTTAKLEQRPLRSAITTNRYSKSAETYAREEKHDVTRGKSQVASTASECDVESTKEDASTTTCCK